MVHDYFLEIPGQLARVLGQLPWNLSPFGRVGGLAHTARVCPRLTESV